MVIIVLGIATFFLSYSNGANDNFKGVATLYGSGVASFKQALSWATITTFLGSISALVLASTLLENFSGKGLVPDALLLNTDFALSLALGAGITVFIATKIGMPVSTTHALVGGLWGIGMLVLGGQFNYIKLGQTFLLPLILGPVAAFVGSLLLYLLFTNCRKLMKVDRKTCLCIGDTVVPVESACEVQASAVLLKREKRMIVGTEGYCQEVYQGDVLGLSANRLLSIAHFLSAGITSFARGLNDTPKILSLLLVVNTLNVQWGMLAIGTAMAIGGLINSRRVAQTMSNKISTMNQGQGFTANMVTGLLVTSASVFGLPVSTTHVSVGAIFGIGKITKSTDKSMVASIVLSWVLTLPVGALCAMLIFWFLQLV